MGVSDLAESSAERIELVLPPADRVSGGVKSAHDAEHDPYKYQQGEPANNYVRHIISLAPSA